MKKQVQPGQGNQSEKHLAEFVAAATRLEKHLDKLGITEKQLLDAAANARERMLTEVYGLEPEELIQP